MDFRFGPMRFAGRLGAKRVHLNYHFTHAGLFDLVVVEGVALILLTVTYVII